MGDALSANGALLCLQIRDALLCKGDFTLSAHGDFTLTADVGFTLSANGGFTLSANGGFTLQTGTLLFFANG